MDEQRKNAVEQLKNASPLEIPGLLQELELYDAQSSQEIIDEVYEQFSSGEDLVEGVVVPVFSSVIDGFLQRTSIGKKAQKKGLTAFRIVNECRGFTYDSQSGIITDVDGRVEYRNAEDFRENFGKNVRTEYKGNRSVFDNKRKAKYRKNAVEKNGDSKNLVDEYTGQKNIYEHKNNPDNRRNDPQNRYQAQADHIVPLAKIHKDLKGNFALSDKDIAAIGNIDDNFALTAGYINQGIKGKGGKEDLTVSEFIKDQNKREKEGRENLGLSEETKRRMLEKEKEANKAIEKETNKLVNDNLTGKNGSDKAKEIHKQNAKNAAHQAKDYAVGNLILFIIKPLYYEISDSFKNGLQEGVGANSGGEALKIRFGRLKRYVVQNAAGFLGDSIWDFVKGFVSSLIEGIIGLFVGMLKQVLKIIKEGIKIFVQSAKVLFGKDSHKMSPAEKGDAIIKILGGSVTAILGVGVEFLLNKIGIGEPWSIILSTMLSGVAAALFMYLLNKVDLFSVKAEKRRNRIIEIFEERIKDINEAAEAYNTIAIETLKTQRENFETITENISNGIKSNNIININEGLYQLANHLKVELPYSNTEEFCDYMDSAGTISL